MNLCLICQKPADESVEDDTYYFCSEEHRDEELRREATSHPYDHQGIAAKLPDGFELPSAAPIAENPFSRQSSEDDWIWWCFVHDRMAVTKNVCDNGVPHRCDIAKASRPQRLGREGTE